MGDANWSGLIVRNTDKFGGRTVISYLSGAQVAQSGWYHGFIRSSQLEEFLTGTFLLRGVFMNCGGIIRYWLGDLNE